MPAKELVTKVWIEEGCIVCDACETASPDVFEVTDDTCVIRPEALTPDFTQPRTDAIVEAAEECPVDVIKFDTVAGEAPVEAPVASPSTAQTADATVEKDTGTGTSKPTDVESAVTTKAKSPEAPAPAAVAEPTSSAKEDKGPSSPPVERPAAKPAAQPRTSMAGEPDPAIAALLKAAMSRGGSAGILRKQESVPDSVQTLQGKDPSELPPDARQAKVMEAAKKAKKNPDAQRRAVAGSAALTVGWVAFGSGLGFAAGPAFARFMMPNVLEEPDPRVRVGKFQRYLEMAPGDVIEDYKPKGIWIVRDRNRLAALSIICTHLGCIPNWLPNDRKFKCPCHGSGYKPNGINFEGPTPRPLERFRLYIEDGIVVVDKSKKYQYELGQWDQPGSYLEL